MKEYRVTENELTSIADAIREKADTDTPYEFPFGFIDAIDALDVGEPMNQYSVATTQIFEDKIRIREEGFPYAY